MILNSTTQGQLYNEINERKAEDTRLQNNINTVNTRVSNIIAQSGTSGSEVVSARTNVNSGISYIDLADRLDKENSELKSNIDEKTNGIKFSLTQSDLEQGTWFKARPIAVDTRVRNKKPIKVTKGQAISYFPNGQRVMLSICANIPNGSEQEYLQVVNFTNNVGLLKVENDGFLYVAVAKQDDSSISIDQFSAKIYCTINFNNGYVNAKDFGAVNDGVTDNTLILQHLINNFSCVYLPPSDEEKPYMITSLSLRTGCSLLGGGYKSQLACKTRNENGYLLNISNVNNVKVSGLRLDCRKAINGINLDKAHFCTIDNLFIDYAMNGITIKNGGDNAIDKCIIVNVSKNGFMCRCADTRIENCTVGNCQNTGFDLTDCTMMQINNCKAYVCGMSGNEDDRCLILNDYCNVNGFIAQGAYHSSVSMRKGNIISGLIIEATNIITRDGTTTDIISDNLIINGDSNNIHATVVDGFFCFSDYVINHYDTVKGNMAFISLAKTKESNTLEGENYIVPTRSTWENNYIMVDCALLD